MHILDDIEEQVLENYRKQVKGLENPSTLLLTWEGVDPVFRTKVADAVARLAFETKFGGAIILPKRGYDIYVTGAGQQVRVHTENEDCRQYGCVVHHPTTHSMSEFPTLWRGDRGIMERTCPHGVGHPDPDGIAFIARTRGAVAAKYEAVHGCCGCCR